MNARRNFMKKIFGGLSVGLLIPSVAKSNSKSYPRDVEVQRATEELEKWTEGFAAGIKQSQINQRFWESIEAGGSISSDWQVNTQYFSLRPLIKCIAEKNARPSFFTIPGDIRVSLSGRIVAMDRENKIITVEMNIENAKL